MSTEAEQAVEKYLYPCPFCGSADLRLKPVGLLYYVECGHCHAASGPYRLNMILEAWNLRAEPKAKAEPGWHVEKIKFRTEKSPEDCSHLDAIYLMTGREWFCPICHKSLDVSELLRSWSSELKALRTAMAIHKASPIAHREAREE